ISTGAGVLAAQVSPAERRGEALGVYYVATALSFSVGPPLGLFLYGSGGMGPCFAAAAVLGLGILVLVWGLAGRPATGVSARRFRWLSPAALPAAATVVLVNVGYSWFYALFSACIIVGRVGLRGLSDRVGRVRVIVPAVVLIALSYLLLALPPTV